MDNSAKEAAGLFQTLSQISTHAFRWLPANSSSATIRKTNRTPNYCNRSVELSQMMNIYRSKCHLKAFEGQTSLSEHFS